MPGKESHDERTGFLELYMRYTAKQESPDAFHFWTAVTILSAALGRKCFLNRGYYKLYPNLFTILVAGSARCRKSTAIGLGVRLLDGVKSINVIGGKITPEKFVNEIFDSTIVTEASKDIPGTRTTPATLVYSSELSVFLTKQSYGEPLIHILTDLFDCPDSWTYKTKNKGSVELHNVFISILAATTPDGIAQGIPQSAMLEGFASRILFIFQKDTTRRNAFPVLSSEEIDMYIRLKRQLQDISLLRGEFMLTQEARDWFVAWYEEHMKDLPSDKRLEGMYGRKHDHLLRIAMCMAAAYHTITIDIDCLAAALIALNAVEANAPEAFTEMGADANTPHYERALSIMRKFKRVHYSQLLRRLHPINIDIFKKLIETMLQSQYIKLDEKEPRILIWIGD